MISILGATTLLALTGVFPFLRRDATCMWRRMNTVSDCAGSKTTLLPEEHGGMIISETGTVHRGLEKTNEKKKTHVVIANK